MKILVINSSMRSSSQSLKVSQWLKDYLSTKDDVSTELYDLHTQPLALDLDLVWNPETVESQTSQKFKELISNYDGYVLVTPEWHGQASAALVNMFNHVGLEMAHKPALITAVSAVKGGSYPVAQIRGFAYKNSRVNFIPENLIVRGVNDVMNSATAEADNKADEIVQAQAKYACDLLLEYTKALVSVRDSGVIDHKTFENGM